MYECRCDERRKTKTEGSTPLTYTVFLFWKPAQNPRPPGPTLPRNREDDRDLKFLVTSRKLHQNFTNVKLYKLHEVSPESS